MGDLPGLEAFLRLEDAVMEPAILGVVRRYVSAGGHPPYVVELLTEGYRGYAQMASLVCQWLDVTNSDPSVEGTPQQKAAQASEATYLRDLARQRFDPARFSVLGSGPPPWLDGLIAEPAGRQLIYELSAAHQNCLLLSFAIHKILKAGHEDEVAQHGSTLAGYFTVFHRLLASRLRELAGAAPERAAQLANELKETCCQGEHTYAHAQALLVELGREPGGGRFRRLAQELEAHAAARHGGAAWRLYPAFLPAARSDQDAAAAAQVARMLAGAGQAADPVMRLQRLYAAHPAPSVEALRHPKVFELLTTGLFTPHRKLEPAQQEAYVGLLATAAAARDGQQPGTLDTANVADTVAALRVAQALAASASSGKLVAASERSPAESALSHPCAAMGVLHWARAQLGGRDYWRESPHASAAPALLGLLALIIRAHPLLHARAVDVLIAALGAMGNSKPDIARQFLDACALILSLGEAPRVLRGIEGWARAADPSLTRHFVFRVLDQAAPPYSAEFAGALLRLMVASGVRRSRAGTAAGRQVDQLEQFAAAAGGLAWAPPLGAKEAAFLADLRVDRAY